MLRATKVRMYPTHQPGGDPQALGQAAPKQDVHWTRTLCAIPFQAPHPRPAPATRIERVDRAPMCQR
jgi:hypothetical protein